MPFSSCSEATGDYYTQAFTKQTLKVDVLIQDQSMFSSILYKKLSINTWTTFRNNVIYVMSCYNALNRQDRSLLKSSSGKFWPVHKQHLMHPKQTKKKHPGTTSGPISLQSFPVNILIQPGSHLLWNRRKMRYTNNLIKQFQINNSIYMELNSSRTFIKDFKKLIIWTNLNGL